MIISCPECSGPFELPDEHIAELVQLECPHCEFRMILDFAAANDAALVEPGMKMASGFRSTADYRASVAPAPREAAEPRPETPAARQPIEERLEPASSPQPRVPARAAPTSPAPGARPSVPAGMRTKTVVGIVPPAQPSRSSEPPTDRPDLDEEDEPPTTLHKPSEDAPSAEPSGAAPRADAGIDGDRAVPMEPLAKAAPALAGLREPSHGHSDDVVPSLAAAARGRATPISERSTVEVSQPSPTQPKRAPAHTPGAAAVTAAVSKAAATDARSSELDVPDSAELEVSPGSSSIGKFVVAILLFAALALVAFSLAMKGTPDPRPLLEDLYRQYAQ